MTVDRDVSDRAEREAELQRQLVAVFLAFQNLDPRQVDWVVFARRVEDAITGPLADSYQSAAAGMLSGFGVTANPEAVRSDALEWAKQRAQQIANDLVLRSRERIRELIAAQRFGELAATWLLLTGSDRAAGVAITETTSALVAGQGRAGEYIEQDLGQSLAVAWHTARDAKVCPICSPLDNQPSDRWRDEYPFGPPAHPNCRCWLSYRL